MFRWDAMAAEHRSLVLAAQRTFAEMTNSITVQRGEGDVSPETLQQRISERGLQNDVLIGWSHIHGYAQLFIEGQFTGFAAEEGEDAFIERTLRESVHADQPPAAAGRLTSSSSNLSNHRKAARAGAGLPP